MGSEAVTWMEKNLNLTRGQAVQKGQQLLNANLIHHVCFSQPFLDGYYFYRFQQDVDTPILNSHFIWNLSRRSENILASLHHLLYDIYDQYLSSSGKEFNLQSFLVSPQYNEMNFSLGELQNLDLFSMTQNQKKGFFLNIYNLMVSISFFFFFSKTPFFKIFSLVYSHSCCKWWHKQFHHNLDSKEKFLYLFQI